MGTSVLCIFIGPLIVVEDGFRFTYFHSSSFSLTCGHSFIVFLRSFWNFAERSLSCVYKVVVMDEITDFFRDMNLVK
jgi:hypothetical protein